METGKSIKRKKKELGFQCPFQGHVSRDPASSIGFISSMYHYLPTVPRAGEQALNTWAFRGHLKSKRQQTCVHDKLPIYTVGIKKCFKLLEIARKKYAPIILNSIKKILIYFLLRKKMQGYLIPPLIIDIVIKVIFSEAKKKNRTHTDCKGWIIQMT